MTERSYLVKMYLWHNIALKIIVLGVFLWITYYLKVEALNKQIIKNKISWEKSVVNPYTISNLGGIIRGSRDY